MAELYVRGPLTLNCHSPRSGAASIREESLRVGFGFASDILTILCGGSLETLMGTGFQLASDILVAQGTRGSLVHCQEG